jgi:hypothetical protein
MKVTAFGFEDEVLANGEVEDFETLAHDLMFEDTTFVQIGSTLVRSDIIKTVEFEENEVYDCPACCGCDDEDDDYEVEVVWDSEDDDEEFEEEEFDAEDVEVDEWDDDEEF